MLSTHKHITTYKGYEIYQRLPGFEYTPIILGKIASYIVKKNNNVAIFAFSYSLLDAMADENLKEEKLLKAALEIIKKQIDNQKVENKTDYTFEYKPQSFFPVSNPQWWIKAF